jgi:superfamily II DNA or RNA helicase
MATALKLPEWQVGSLVSVREREWVVLACEDEILRLRPLYGSEAETCGIHLGIEGRDVRTASFPLPDPKTAGDFIAGRLLRDAARLSLRSGAGPFRSLGRLSVRPRPYQFVPLIMALRLDPVRLLIADDVGVGKTIEAALIARELLDRGDVKRICVLCPPHLCDQWQRELETKFHLRAAVIRTSTLARLERELPRKDQGIYGYYQHLVVSIDFAKSERRRSAFLQDCPDLVIVDEAHTASQPYRAASREQQQRHDLVRELAARDPSRHLLLLTATPHSGIEQNFLSLLALLDPHFANLTLTQLSERERARLAKHFVQRRRADVQKWLGEETPFPTRVSDEAKYRLTKDYEKLFYDVLAFTRETVLETGLDRPRQRVRYWAALSLLRCLMSSPAAAVQAFSKRTEAVRPRTEDSEDDEQRQRETMDALREEGTLDTVPEAAIEAGEVDVSERDRRRLREFGRRAEAIVEAQEDTKIEKAAEVVADFLRRGFRPIVYCRFIATAKYVAEELELRLKGRFSDIHAVAVTGETGSDEEREARVAELAESPRRVLVATDCMSEGINLQDHFDAVVHYDLPWNPNRLEQREGRVDRYGQPKPEVRATILYGEDNPIDAIVLDVLIRKAREIYKSLGVSVPVPVNAESVVQAVIQVLFESRRPVPTAQMRLEFAEFGTVQQIHDQWDRDAARERESRTRFAQHAIKPDEVSRELEAMDEVLGNPDAVRGFLNEASQRMAFGLKRKNGSFLLDCTRLEDIACRLGWKKPQEVIFDGVPPADGVQVIGRNHPLVVALSDRILGEAFAGKPGSKFARCGAIYTTAVNRRVALALLRLRYRLTRRQGGALFAEEVLATGFRRTGEKLEWLPPNDEETLRLLEQATPVANISEPERQKQVAWSLEVLAEAHDDLKAIAKQRAARLEESYARLRQYISGGRIRAECEPPDILGVYVLLPGGNR